ncbi:MAG: type II toxin-antitoxin system PemK/MazF family toxin [Candidatus Latescibacteria bacterium]|nr:type II toxin-antitoxin system PemK/MazF family toxin [Candidatus Latescibacterota bacterium]
MNKGTVVLTPFPFTNLAGQKNRPAIVLSRSRQGEDVVLAFVSSVVREPTEADVLISTDHPDFEATGLKRDSVVKLDKLATINRKIILGRLGDLSPELLEEVNRKLRAVLDL